jgi:hypothetical protein
LAIPRSVTREGIGRIDAFDRVAAMDVCCRRCGSKYQRDALLDVPLSTPSERIGLSATPGAAFGER